MAILDVVFAADDGFARHLGTAMLSLLENNRGQSLRVHVITGGFEADNRTKLEAIAADYDVELRIIVVSDDVFSRLVVTRDWYSKANYYRLLIPEFVEAERALYLDADLVVESSIAELFDAELGRNALAAVEDPAFPAELKTGKLGLAPETRYFNSGVMLIDIAKWRESRLHWDVIQFVAENPGRITLVDQCGLNGVVRGNWTRLHPKWNAQTGLLEVRPAELRAMYSADEIEEALSEPCVIHFSGKSKPWQFRNRHPLRKRYWLYRRMTPFSPYQVEGFTLLAVLKRLVPKRLKRHFWVSRAR